MTKQKVFRYSIVVFAAALLALLFVVWPAKAEMHPTSGTTGTLSWTFDEATGKLTIRKASENTTSYMPDYQHYKTRYWTDQNGETHDSDVPWIWFRRQIKSIYIYDTVNIGDGAFYGLARESSDSDPVTVQLMGNMRIGKEAFRFTKLKSINLSNATEIGERAFFDSILSVTSREQILNASKIGAEAFGGFGPIKQLRLNCAEIGDYAFKNASIEEILITSFVKKIGEGAFLQSNAKAITFGANTKAQIGKYAFAGHKSGYEYAGIYIPSTITSISEKAFGYDVSASGEISNKSGVSPIILTEEGSAADAYGKANGLDVLYNKQFFTNYDNNDWIYDPATKTVWIQSAGNSETNSTPAASDPYWSDFVAEHEVRHLVIGGGRRGWLGEGVNTVSKGVALLKDLETVEFNDWKLQSIGEEAFRNLKHLRSVTFNSQALKSGMAVESVGLRAFEGCTALDEISFPDSVTEIGVAAFKGCTSLADVNFGKGIQTISVEAFSGSGMTSLSLGSGEGAKTISIGGYAFAECKDLERVQLGPNVTTMPMNMFENCTALSEVSYSDQLTTIGYQVFKGCRSLEIVMMGRGLTTIGGEAFLNTKVNELFIPDSVTSIDSQALCYVTSGDSTKLIEDAKLYVMANSAGLNYARNNSVPYEICVGETLGNCSWRYHQNSQELHIAGSGPMEEYGATNTAPWDPYSGKVKSIYIGDGMTTISKRAFEETYLNLEEVHIGASVETIGYRAFFAGGTSHLKTIEVPASVTAIEEQAIGWGRDNYGKLYQVPGLVMYVEKGSVAESYAIENGISYEYHSLHGETGSCSYDFNPGTGRLVISGNGAMESYEKSTDVPWNYFKDKIKAVVIKAGITAVGRKAFMDCPNLEWAILPDGLLKIEQFAFSACPKLKEIYLPASLTTIEALALGFTSSFPDNPDSSLEASTGKKNPLKILYLTYTDPIRGYAESSSQITIERGIQGVAGSDYWDLKGRVGLVDGMALTIYGDGSFACEEYPWKDFENEIKELYIDERITAIPDEAFDGLSFLTEVKIEGEYSVWPFGHYDNITSIGKRAFAYCTSLKSIGIPSGVDVIEDSTFEGCESLASIDLDVTSVGVSAFDGCENLRTLILSDRLETIADGAFAATSIETLELPENLVSIGSCAFYDTCLESITIPESVRTIGERAFHTTEMTFVEIPKTVREIGAYAFGFWYPGTTVDEAVEGFYIIARKNSAGYIYAMEYGLPWIDGNEGDIEDIHWSFNEKKGLLTINGEGEIPDDTAPWSKFKGKITQIDIREGITGIGSYAFANLSDGSGAPADRPPVSVELPGSLLSIGDYAFLNTKLEEIKLPSGLLTIGEGAFWCTWLSKIDLGDTVQEIGDMAFVNTLEESVIIPPSVTAIGEKAFNRDKWYPDYEPGWGEYSVRCFPYVMWGIKGSAAQRFADGDENIEFKEYQPEKPPAPPHVHEMICVEAKPVTETEDGHKEYYVCEICKEWFEDPFGEVLIEDHNSVTIPAPTLSLTSASLKSGKTLTLKVLNGEAVSWKSSNKAVAKVSASGKVTALKKGTVTITATLPGGTPLTCKVKVTTSPTIKVGGKKFKAKTTYNIKKGKTLTVAITGKAADVKNVYKSGNKKIAKVTSKATATKVKIKGSKKGKTTVTIKINGVTFKIKVKVK